MGYRRGHGKGKWRDEPLMVSEISLDHKRWHYLALQRSDGQRHFLWLRCCG